MEFPKPFMRSGELVAMGFSRELLRKAYGDRRQRFAIKISPEKRNSPIQFDTAGLADWLEKNIENQMRGMKRT